MTSRRSTAAPILAALAIVLATLGAYVGGYYWLGYVFEDQHRWTGRVSYERRYAADWQRIIFAPATRIESLLCGVPISAEIDPFAAER